MLLLSTSPKHHSLLNLYSNSWTIHWFSWRTLMTRPLVLRCSNELGRQPCCFVRMARLHPNIFGAATAQGVRTRTFAFTEAKKSLAVVGKSDPEFLLHPQTHEPFRDQELYQDVAGAFVALAGKTENWQLDAIVAPAYEGGHPDHDACCFLAHLLGSELAVSVWEMPLYNRAQSGGIVHQKFVRPNGTEIIVSLTDDELEKRRAMFAGYASQPDASEFVNSSVEVYRPQVAYDFGLAPHAGQLNYEAWGWPMTGTQLCEAFQSCLHLAARTNGLASSQGTSKSVG